MDTVANNKVTRLNLSPAVEQASELDQVINEKDKVKKRELRCLAENVYHEARGESITGKRAVAWVTMNRVTDKRYPNTVCDVVYQARLAPTGFPLRNKCQFSWYCDGKSDAIRNKSDWKDAMQIAEQVWNNHMKIPDPVIGAVMYHSDYIDSPKWAKDYTKLVRIDKHIFYK